jgi:hypothetical protein
MKTIFITTAALLISLSSFARNNDNVNYVITNNDTIVCENLSVGLTNARLHLENGQLIKVKTSDVKSYSTGGRIFDNLPVYFNDKPTGEKAFMELIRLKNGFQLYKYSGNGQSVLLVFKDGKYCVGVSDRNKATLLDFFQVNEL